MPLPNHTDLVERLKSQGLIGLRSPFQKPPELKVVPEKVATPKAKTLTTFYICPECGAKSQHDAKTRHGRKCSRKRARIQKQLWK
jgi:ribosomal protein L40E